MVPDHEGDWKMGFAGRVPYELTPKGNTDGRLGICSLG